MDNYTINKELGILFVLRKLGQFRERFKTEGIFYNAQMNAKLIRKYCQLDEKARELLKLAMNELGFSARAYDKILKVSRTMADLGASKDILAEHISEAVQYRSLDR